MIVVRTRVVGSGESEKWSTVGYILKVNGQDFIAM